MCYHHINPIIYLNHTIKYYIKYTSDCDLSPNITAKTAPVIIIIIAKISLILINSPNIFHDNKVFQTNVIDANGPNNDAGAKA